MARLTFRRATFYPPKFPIDYSSFRRDFPMKNLQKNVRLLHRYLGALVLGLTLVYVLSGVVLIFRDKGVMTYVELESVQLEPGLRAEALPAKLKLKRFQLVDSSDSNIQFRGGNYHPKTGLATLERKRYPTWLDKMSKLHKANSSKGISIFALLYGACLAVLALSSLFIYKPGTKLFKRYTLTVGGGVVLAIGALLIV